MLSFLKSPPESSDIARRLQWYVSVRWFFLLALFAPGILGELYRQVPAQTLWGDALLVFAGLVYNTGFWLVSRLHLTERQLRRLAQAQISFDLLLVAFIIFSHGGIESRSIILFAIPILISAVVLGARSSYTVALMAAALYDAILILDLQGLIPRLDSLNLAQHTDIGYILSSIMFYNAALLVVAAVANFRDVSLEHRQAAREQERLHRLRQANAEAEANRLRDEALLNSIGEGLIFIDDQGNISNINPAASQMLDYSDKELIGQWFPKAVNAVEEDGRDIDPLDRPILKALGTGKVVTEVTRYQRKDKTTFAAAITVSPVLVEGKPIGAIEVFRDITKEQELEKAKEEFVSLASHQLRTPATGVKAFVSMLMDGYAGKLTAKQQEFVHKIYETNERQLQIVSDMLNTARVDAGHLVLEIEPTDLTTLVYDISEEQVPTMKERGQKIHRDLPKQKLPAMVDPRLFRMVADNLMSNASKYTPNGGDIYVTLSQSDSHVELQVKDSGVGIAKSDLSKLFKRFSRIGNTLSTERGGTGLGLYLVQNIVKLHHGSIKVESSVGKGTTFIVSVPLRQPEPKKPHNPAQTA